MPSSNSLTSYPKAMRLEVETAFRLASVVGSPVAQHLTALLEREAWDEIVDLRIDASDYEDPEHFALDYLITRLLSKSPNLPLGIDRRQVAIDSFFETEERCRATNDHVGDLISPQLLHDIKQRIAYVLPPITYKMLHEIEHLMRHGKGATATLEASGLVLSDKFDKNISMTPALEPFAQSIMGPSWTLDLHDGDLHTEIALILHARLKGESMHIKSAKRKPRRRAVVEVVPGSVVSTVPKNAKTDRLIAKEPSLNVFGQLGIGTWLKRRLKRVGVDLYDQTRNQGLAQRAYKEGLATIDLSAASDSISWRVVLDLLPSDWFDLLNLFRCSHTRVPGSNGDQYHELEKFSSMGNGYTFELESLLFYAVVTAIVPKDLWHQVSVYGDDIICPQTYASKVIDALEALGFQCNRSKSFLAGNFYESCGKDCFKGVDVTPFYLRGGNEVIPYPLQIANQLRLYARRRGAGVRCDARFYDVWVWLVKQIPRSWRDCRVPDYFGDLGLIVSLDEYRAPRSYRSLGMDWYYPEFEGIIVQFKRMRYQAVTKRTWGVLQAQLSKLPASWATRDSRVHLPSSDGWLEFVRNLADEIENQPLGMGGREFRRGCLMEPAPECTLVPYWSEGLCWG